MANDDGSLLRVQCAHSLGGGGSGGQRTTRSCNCTVRVAATRLVLGCKSAEVMDNTSGVSGVSGICEVCNSASAGMEQRTEPRSSPNLLRKRVTQRSIEGGEKSSTAAAAKDSGIEAWAAECRWRRG
jgi:hypothetical protein